jgi:hypothetical protein
MKTLYVLIFLLSLSQFNLYYILSQQTYDYTQFKCPSTSASNTTDSIKATYINLETKEVICTYHPPQRRSSVAKQK